MDLPVKLEIFEGPLDLLLHLIRKNEVDINDIPIALITRQYLDYLDVMRDLNISMAGDFLVMAATLAHIKSRTLLPSHGAAAGDDEADDPRTGLVVQLMEHQRLKEAAESLNQRTWLDRDVFTRSAGRQEVAAAVAGQPELIVAGLFDLIEAFRRLLGARPASSTFVLPAAQVSLEDRIGQLLELLREHQTATFLELFAGDHSRAQMVVTFLAVLELTRLGLIRLYQERPQEAGPGDVDWGPLRIYFTPLSEAEAEEVDS
ncbi:MAG: segregation/condensation protein A [Pseudomonadota bacterium]